MGEKKGFEKTTHKEFKVSGWGYRHQQCVILFWVLTIAYTMRSCMGVLLVAMTDLGDTTQNGTESLNVTKEFKMNGVLNALMLVPPYPAFNWDKKVQDTVIASFFWGYMLLQIPAGQLAHRFGARYLLTGAMTINCVMSILLPMASYYGSWVCTVICRIAQGLSQACIVPGIHTTLGKWVPLHERGRLAAFVYGGVPLGTVLGLPISGFISSSSLGWPGAYRFYGILSGMIGVLLWFLISDTPTKHPKISVAEKKYIEDDLGSSDKKMAVPWSQLFRHKGVYAIIIAHVGSAWGSVTLYSEVPAFMDKIMKVDIKANGMLTALPFLVMFFTNFFFSWLTDWLIVRNIMSVSNVRKLANSLGFVPAAIGMLSLAYAPQDIFVVESILVIVCAFQVASHCGFQVNHMDISPNYAGTMMSMSNFVSSIGASVAPMVYGFILTDVTDKYLWRQVFFLAAGLFFFTNLLYVIFGTGKKADWNDPSYVRDSDPEEFVPMVEKPKI